MKEHARIIEAGKNTRFKKGHQVNLGRVFSEETRAKMRKNHKGMTGKRQPLSQILAISGKNNWNWQGGITPKNLKIRGSLQYKNWRKEVFTRDDFTCQTCGKRGVEIHADHIEAFALLLEKHEVDSVQKALVCAELWDISNGWTLCVPCHRKTPNYGAYAKKSYGQSTNS